MRLPDWRARWCGEQVTASCASGATALTPHSKACVSAAFASAFFTHSPVLCFHTFFSNPLHFQCQLTKLALLQQRNCSQQAQSKLFAYPPHHRSNHGRNRGNPLQDRFRYPAA